MVIHVATEAKWGKHIAGTMSFTSWLVNSLLVSGPTVLRDSAHFGRQKSDIFLFKIIIFWQLRKEDITRERKMPKEFTPSALNFKTAIGCAIDF